MNDRIKLIIAKMILRNVFWGQVFSFIRRISDDAMPYIMGVAIEKDGNISLYYNPKLIATTNDDVIEKVLEHEGMHLINKHLSRLINMLNLLDENKKKNYEQIWNYASDCASNEQAKLPDVLFIDNKPMKLCHPKCFNLPEKQTSEFYFQELLKQKNNKQDKNDGNSEDGEGDNYNVMIGDHSLWTKNISDCEDLSEIAKKAERNIKYAIKKSIQNFNRNRGTLPGNLSELLNEFLDDVKLPYYEIISRYVKQAKHLAKYKRCETKLNRKRSFMFLMTDDGIPDISPFPGKKRDYTFNISILIDTSMSMSNLDILEALSSVKHILEKDKYCKITIIECDTQVNKIYEVKKISEIDFQITGRGGTTLQPGLKKCRELNSDITLCFTDGYIEDVSTISKKHLPKKLLWILNTKNNTYVKHYGNHIFIE